MLNDRNTLTLYPNQNKIRELRQIFNLTQKELGDRLNISQSNLSRIENEIIDAPYSTIKKILDFFFNLKPELFIPVELLRLRLRKCESPLEQIFYIKAFHKIHELVPQYQVDKLRVDFAIPSLKIAIECDGKDFHTTIEQINRDNWRDAFLNSEGWTVQRFTGPDIMNNFDWCIKRILRIIQNKEK